MLYHSTKAEIFLRIFDEQESVVGREYPTYFFYGKPAFFCQFSDKLNRMAFATLGDGCYAKEFSLHDSDIALWPEEYSEIFRTHFGTTILRFKGDLSAARKAAVFMFGSNKDYFNGVDAHPHADTPLLRRFGDYIRALKDIHTGQVEKTRTIEIKTEPVKVDENCIIFLVEPNLKTSINNDVLEHKSDNLKSKRDSAVSVKAAAEKAHAKGLKVLSCLDQRPQPSELESLYSQLFSIIRRHSMPMLA